MAATENKFRAETASGPDLGRNRSASLRPARKHGTQEGRELARTDIGSALLVPRAPVAARTARPVRGERAA